MDKFISLDQTVLGYSANPILQSAYLSQSSPAHFPDNVKFHTETNKQRSSPPVRVPAIGACAGDPPHPPPSCPSSPHLRVGGGGLRGCGSRGGGSLVLGLLLLGGGVGRRGNHLPLGGVGRVLLELLGWGGRERVK